jgi:hypothetical protein
MMPWTKGPRTSAVRTRAVPRKMSCPVMGEAPHRRLRPCACHKLASKDYSGLAPGAAHAMFSCRPTTSAGVISPKGDCRRTPSPILYERVLECPPELSSGSRDNLPLTILFAPRQLPRKGIAHAPAEHPGGIVPLRWEASSRSPGRHYPVIPRRLRRNPHKYWRSESIRKSKHGSFRHILLDGLRPISAPAMDNWTT